MTSVVSVAVAAAGPAVVALFGERVKVWIEKRRAGRGVKKENERIYKVFSSYGVAGLGLLPPAITGAPAGVALGLASGVKTGRLLIWAVAGVILWSVILLSRRRPGLTASRRYCPHSAGPAVQVRTVLRKTFVLIGALIAAGAFSGAGASAAERRFLSPTGEYEVAFTELDHKIFSFDEMRKGDEFVSRVLHRIDFYKKGSSTPAASIRFYDVYGWEVSERPAAPEVLFDAIRWSPNDGMAALGEEGWATAPGTPSSRIINLNPSYPWKEATVAFDEFIWLDEARFIGGYHSDCDYGVAVFDGRTGLVTPVMPSESPMGYELISTSTGEVVTVRRVSDNCALEMAAPECFTINVKTGVRARWDRCP